METMYLALIILLLGAVVFDIRTRRIPNALTLGGVLLGLALRAYLNGPLSFYEGGEGLLIAGVVGLGFWYTKMIGGADHKLLMAVGAFVGWPQIVPNLVAVALAGGVQALAWALWAHGHETDGIRSWRQALRQTRMPYSLSIACGTGAVLILNSYGIL